MLSDALKYKSPEAINAGLGVFLAPMQFAVCSFFLRRTVVADLEPGLQKRREQFEVHREIWNARGIVRIVEGHMEKPV